ncbi:MAG: FtsX-like permease family protein [Candidatus Thorarchaeota archaeon]
MALISDDHPAFVAKRRRAVTMLGFLVISTMVLGISIYLDSDSVHVWNELTDVGPYGMRALGEDIENYVGEIRDLPDVERAAVTTHALGCLRIENESPFMADNYLRTGKGFSLDQTYFENFPSVFNLVAGRFPQSEVEIAIPGYVAEEAHVWIGSLMYFSPYVEEGLQPVFVVGVYQQEEVSRALDYYKSIAVVLPSLLNPNETEYSICVDIDRSKISPFDTTNSLRFLEQVEISIISLYPGYIEELRYSKFHVSDYLALSVEDYNGWLGATRFEQIARGQILLVLGMLLTLMITRYNFEERQEEIKILSSRGASGLQAQRRVLGEIFALSMVAGVLAIPLGGLVSRIASASVGFLEFETSLLLEEPFLISVESILLSIAVGAVLTGFGYVFYRMLQPKAARPEKEVGRLARLTRGLRLLRWDFLVVISSSLFLVMLLLGGREIRTNPFILTIQFLIPMTLFMGIASLTIKAMARVGHALSRALPRLVGTFSALVGARRAGRDANVTGPLVLTLALTMVLVVNTMATSSTVVNTQLIHTRFIVGSDVTFLLDPQLDGMWREFASDVKNHSLCADGTFVSVGRLSLSEGSGAAASFVAVSPEEYSHVGYDHTGTRLDKSYMSELLAELETSLTGALITEDISQAYQLGVGDSLRAFSLGGDNGSTEFNILGVLPAIPAPMIPGAAVETTVGLGRVLLNVRYIETRIDLVHAAHNYFCVGTQEGANSTFLIEDLKQEYGLEFITGGIGQQLILLWKRSWHNRAILMTLQSIPC